MRAAMMDAAEELIARHGLHDAALVQIAKRAGVAVGTLYNYFADRDELIRRLFETRRATLRPRLQAAMAAGDDLAFEPRLRGFVRGVLASFDSHRTFIKVAIENEHLKIPASTIQQDLLDGAVRLVAAGVAEGALSEDKAALLPLLITSAIKAVCVQRVRHGGELASDADSLVELLLDGARRRPAEGPPST